MADEPAVGTYDASDEVAANNAKRDADRQARNDADCLRFILSSKPRRSWFYRLLARCHIYGSTFRGEETHTSSFAQGEENIGKQLMLAAIDASPDLYMTMIREQREEEQRLDAVRARENERQQGAGAPTAADQVPDLPPPAGYPGHKPPKK